MKYLWLIVVRFTHKVLNKFPSILSYFFLAFSVIACLVILVPSCFDRVLVLSYYISEHELPMMYELYGEVKVLDEKGNIVNQNVEVFVGGYSITIFISTHSVTMIKSADKNHIISIEETENGKYDAVCPCYPAKAIGNVDFIDNVIYDAVFFVEDDMARTLLKRMIQTCCEEDNRFKTITNCIVPVGGYKQTAELAINTKSQLLNRSVVCAVWDADVFTETIPNDEEIARLYNENRRFIFNLGCTPEVWMIEKLERMDVNIVNRIRTKFHTEPSIIVNSNEYRSCNSPKPRKRAKQKMDVVLEKLSVACGEPKEVVLNEFADILVSNAYTVGQIKAIVAPMLAG